MNVCERQLPLNQLSNVLGRGAEGGGHCRQADMETVNECGLTVATVWSGMILMRNILKKHPKLCLRTEKQTRQLLLYTT